MRLSESSPVDAASPIEVRYVEDRPVRVLFRRCRFEDEGANGRKARVFGRTPIRIGAAEENDLVVEDETSSRVHCEIFLENGHYLVRDLGSTNGTFVDGVRIREAFLRDGAHLRLGTTRMLFSTEDEVVPIGASEVPRFGDVVGRSDRMRTLFALLDHLVHAEGPIVIEGEPGAGKKAIARALHDASPRRRGPFASLDCRTAEGDPRERDLFGQEFFAPFAGGTLVLENVSALRESLQERLLRWIERRAIAPSAWSTARVADPRLVLTSSRPLVEEARSGRLRDDLFERVAMMRVSVPPLRARRDDVPLLVREFLRADGTNRAHHGGRRVLSISREALDRLVSHAWPGNVRELFQTLEHAVAATMTDVVTTNELPAHLLTEHDDDGDIDLASVFDELPTERLERPEGAPESPGPFKNEKEQWVATFERRYIERLLRANGGNISHASRQADIDRKYFRKLMRKHGIGLPVDGEEDP